MDQMLQTLPFLEELSRETIRDYILPRGKITEYGKKAPIFMAQDRVDHISLILKGQVNLMYLLPNDVCSLISKLKEGQALGCELVCTNTRLSPYYAIAAAPCTLFSFPAELILEPGHLPEGERLKLQSRLLRLLSQEQVKKEYHLAILATNKLRERILIYLNMQAARRKTNTFEIPFNREEMALFLRVNRSALSHELSLLKREGIIDFQNNRFTVLQPADRDAIMSDYLL